MFSYTGGAAGSAGKYREHPPGGNRSARSLWRLACRHDHAGCYRLGCAPDRVVSFPRDLLIAYPGGEKARINTVDVTGYSEHESGAAGLWKEVFMQNYGIRIDHYARLHRPGFVQAIDAIDGLDIELPCEVWELAPKDETGEGYTVLYLPAGEQQLDGETALKLVTYRYRGNDWGRRSRQQMVLLAFREQALRLDLLPRIPELVRIVGRNFTSDIGVIDMLRYSARLATQVDTADVHARVLGPEETEVVEGIVAYLIVPKGESVNQAIADVFNAPSITAQRQAEGVCPPRPSWADEYLSSQGLPSASE